MSDQNIVATLRSTSKNEDYLLIDLNERRSLKTNSSYGPIESEMRVRLESLRGSNYPDTFDWAIYDRIAARYGKNQPRGGVVFKTGFKLVNHHSSCSKCHYAFEIDSYGRGCIHNCSYCYAKDQLSSHGYWNSPMPFPLDLSLIRKIFYTVFETSKPSKWRTVLESRVPVRVGSMSDSFMWTDQKYKVTQELLKILKFYRYPYIIFTRSDLVGHDDYLNLMDTQLASIQMSISGNNDYLTKKIEPGAPSVARRYAALTKLNHAGFWTTVRINPLFPRFPDGYFTDPDSIRLRFKSKDKCPELKLIDENFIEEIASTGTKSILAGFVRLSSNAIKSMSEQMDLNIGSFYKHEFYRLNGTKRYSDEEIRYYYRSMKSECDQFKIRFSTCYIGNGTKDYFQYQDLWSNKGDCCDALGNVSSFMSSSQDINWETRTTFSPSKATALEARRLEEQYEKTFLMSKKSNAELLNFRPLPSGPVDITL